jgi:hypothetical protein
MKPFARTVAVLTSLLACACSWFSKGPEVPAAAAPVAPASANATAALPPPPPPLQLHVRTDAKSNLGGPLYVVVRKTDPGAFLAEDYAKIAGDVFPRNADAILSTAVVWPDKEASLVVPRSDAKQVLGVYFLFASPEDGKWRLLVADPCMTRLDVVLGPASILSYEHGGSC